jgi:Patatin-like phospholipase
VNTNRRLLWLALLGTLIWGVMMGIEAKGYKTRDCSPGWRPSTWGCLAESPIAHLELALIPESFRSYVDCDSVGKDCQSYDPSNLDAIAPPNRLWNIEVAKVNTYMDFLFIALYWSVFVLLARIGGGRLSLIVGGAISAAALFDIGENVLLLRALQAITKHADPLTVPGLVSRIKWCLFAASLVLLAIAVAKTMQMSLPPMSVFMVLSALLTVAGVFYIPLLTVALLALALALFLALFHYFPFGKLSWDAVLSWIEFVYLIRFQVMALVLLTLVLPAGFFAAPSMFIGLFDALSFNSFVFVAWAAFQLAFTTMFTSRLVLVYGPERFPGISRLRKKYSLSWPTVGAFACLSAPCLVMMCCGTDFTRFGTVLSPLLKIAGILIALALAILVLWATAKLHRRTDDPDNTAAALYPFAFAKTSQSVRPRPRPNPIDQVLTGVLPSRLQAGILDTAPRPGFPMRRLRSGHKLAALTLFVLLFIYVLGFFYDPSWHLSEHPPAAMFYLLFLLVLLTWLFSGLSFLLDAVRIPVLTAALALSMIGGLARTDHEFTVDAPTAKQNLPTIPPTPEEVVRKWEAKRGPDPRAPIVVVATAGGGIRAEAWTTQVLTSLTSENTERVGFAFDSSLLLVSSVSGGSVGSMYVVGSYDANGKLPLTAANGIRGASSRTSLSAVGWGLLYPDVLRTIPLLGWFVPQTLDRGSTLEKVWLTNWDKGLPSPTPTIASWIKDVRAGIRPAAIFNTTAAESGQRFLIASTAVPQDDNTKRGPNETGLSGQGTLQFATSLAGYDLSVSTAARASATFPFVSPMSRPTPRIDNGMRYFAMHLADGGYYDNSGVMSATQWLAAARQTIRCHPVLILLIDSTPGWPKNGETWSWQRQMVAPVEALLAVRTSSQETRASYELDLAQKYLHDEGLDVEVARMFYPADQLTPLSWHLTDEQKDQITEAWTRRDPAFQSEKLKIANFLGRTHGHP